MSTESVASLLEKLQPDPWRAESGFSPEIETANQALFDSARSSEDKAKVLAEWIANHQPCLFGRIASRADFLSYAILTEQDLRSSDQHIGQQIQAARTRWTRDAFHGRKNGFIILAISPTLASARPDEVVKQLALRLCRLYLLEEAENVTPDKVLHDSIFLELQDEMTATWMWQAGINYFCVQGDKRWWHDHRIPGGMAFSVNSVGHMVKSGILLKAMAALGEQLGVEQMSAQEHKITSLEKALELAMRTIDHAAVVPPSGKATHLVSLPEGSRLAERGQPPIKLTGWLSARNRDPPAAAGSASKMDPPQPHPFQ